MESVMRLGWSVGCVVLVPRLHVVSGEVLLPARQPEFEHPSTTLTG